MYRLLLAVMLFTFASVSGSAQGRRLTYEDILGRWCGDSAEYYFDYEKLTVRRYDGGQAVLWVLRYESSETWINILWRPPHVNTVFAEFSRDGSFMAQQPGRDGAFPRRPFRRC
jgi:hypothetical protein